MRHTYMIGVALLALSACTPPPPMDASREALWQRFGHHSVDDVLLAWSAPTSESKLTNGARLLTYRRATIYDAGSPYETSGGCDATFLAPPPHYQVSNISMKGNDYDCAVLVKNGPGFTRHIAAPPPTPIIYPGMSFYYR